MKILEEKGYEAVIGLEVHMQLLTQSKAFSSDTNEYGALPNTLVSPISLGHPGTLPRLNEKSIEYAVKLGLAIGASIREENQFARKNYFYADLPKGYQITQDKTPICTGGEVKIQVNGTEKSIGITRIHMEEDAGKSIHDQDPFDTLVDLNRAGVPLLEMVTEPDLRSSEEAYQYLTEVRKLVRYLEICDGNMEEGSLRCDANVSVRKKGAAEFGVKMEVKNMNSIRNVQRAIEHEIERQITAIESGETLYQETRNFDAVSGTTTPMRSKEMANDYRYFPEPDLQPAIVSESYIEQCRNELPPLPHELKSKYITELNLNEYDASNLTSEKAVALYFEELVNHTKSFKAAANWIMGPVKSFVNEQGIHFSQFPIPAKQIAAIISLVESNKVSHSSAEKVIFPALLEDSSKDVAVLAEEKNLLQVSDEGALQQYINEAIEAFPDKVEEYKNGKKGLIGLFMGQVMKKSKGQADPKKANELLRQKLESL